MSPGVVRNLKGNGLQTSRQVVDAFYSDLGRRPGCGKVTVQAVATWINSHTKRSQDRTRKPKGPEASGDPASRGGLRLRGIVTRRSKRTLKEDLELVTYNVSSENGSHLVEDFAPPGGPYLSLGEEVDLEVVVRTFVDNMKCAPGFGHENGGAYGTCTHALAECFSLQRLSNSAGVKYPSDE